MKRPLSFIIAICLLVLSFPATVLAEDSAPCAEHSWVERTQKATPSEDGRIYNVCSVCGEEETVEIIAKASKHKLSQKVFKYDGKAKKPLVTMFNEFDDELKAYEYSVSYKNNVKVGTATAVVTLKGEHYTGTTEINFEIDKGSNPITAFGKTVKLNYSDLRKGNITVDRKKAISLKGAKGTVKYQRKSGNSKIKIDKATGKVTVKKKLKKGTYTLKVKVIASGNNNYNKGAQTVYIKIKVI